MAERLETALDVSGLCASFAGAPVLSGVTFSAPRRAVTVLVGRSGSGKTTVLRAVNRLNECFPGYRESGSVTFHFSDGVRPHRGPRSFEATKLRRRVAMVFQTPSPLPLSIRRNLTMPLEVLRNVRGKSASEEVEGALRTVGLWDEVKDRLDDSAETLSGGQKQRLCLARALALKPEMFLFDEPTASLDVRAAERLEKLITSLSAKFPVVMVSHSLEQARRLADQLVVIESGKTVGILTKDQLAEKTESELRLLLDGSEEVKDD